MAFGLSLKVVSVLLILPAAFASVDLETFFPFGPEAGDLRVPTADDNFVEVPLSAGNLYHFFNNTYDKLFVNNNGGVSFNRGVPEFTPNCGPSTVPMIIPYWADVNTQLGGHVFYRESTDAALLAQATTEVHRSFPGIQNLALNWLFIATWADVPFFGASTACNGIQKTNNFQVILVTDGTKSFAMFYFNKITWTTGTASQGTCEGLGGIPAKSGFDLGDGQTFFQLPGSCAAEIMAVTSTSNVDQEGKWIFRVDESFSETPEESSPEPEATTYEPWVSTYEPEVSTYEPWVSSPEPWVSTPEPWVSTQEPWVSTPEPWVSTLEPVEECDPTTCEHSGHCYEYAICSPITRTWNKQACSPGLFWNPPHRANNTNESCTASCDIWDNLAEETQLAYKADETCFSPCFYQEVGECSYKYIFHSHNTDNRDVRLETCPIDTREGRNVPLVWVQGKETCDFCYNAFKSDGSPCCEKYDDVNDEIVTSGTEGYTEIVDYTTSGYPDMTTDSVVDFSQNWDIQTTPGFNFWPAIPIDSSVSPIDSSVAPIDSSVAPIDSSVAPIDSSVAPIDSSVAPIDSSVAPLDSSVAPPAIDDSVSFRPDGTTSGPSGFQPVNPNSPEPASDVQIFSTYSPDWLSPTGAFPIPMDATPVPAPVPGGSLVTAWPIGVAGRVLLPKVRKSHL